MRKKSGILTRFFPNALVQWMLAIGLFLVSGEALANTITQNTSWTIDQASTSTKYRVVAYGDSILGRLAGLKRRLDPDDLFRHTKRLV